MEKKRSQSPQEAAEKVAPFAPSDTDPQGSWTGQPEDPNEIPVQDQDDL